MKTLVKLSLILAVLSAFAFTGCNNNKQTETPTPVERLANLQQQVENDIVALQDLDAGGFRDLKALFMSIDSNLASVDPNEVQNYFDKLNLAQAYLQQFMENKTAMKNKLDYSKKQLVDLQFDVDNGYVNDSLFNVYLERETIAADTVHNQLIYFKDRFDTCQKELNALK